MKKVFLFSALLIAGLIGSQFLELFEQTEGILREIVNIMTMLCLSFIMIHVGYEFEIDKTKLKSYGHDYLIAATAAAFPWIFCSAYFVFALHTQSEWSSAGAWKSALLAGRFAAPTSAGILFSMLAAAGLSATWHYRKTRILAVFDDLDTVLFMIPLKMLLVGLRWELAVIIAVMIVMLWLAWKYLHKICIPISWPYVLGYAAIITGTSEIIYNISNYIDDVFPIHIEVLLPAFVLGCMLGRPADCKQHCDDTREGHQDGPESPEEQKVSTYIASIFMVLVGLSMPLVSLKAGSLSFQSLAVHVIIITLLANLGKMFPLFVYKKEATWKERLAICIGMWPRGEVGAGVLIISLSYGIGGVMVQVAALSLALNLILTGVFIYTVKRLLKEVPKET